MKNSVNFFDGYIEGEELWFSNLNFNALMRMNIVTGKTEMIDTFPGLPKEQENLHLNVVKYNSRLYFIPLSNDTIHIWNLEEEKWDGIIELSSIDDINTISSIQFDNIVWIFSTSLKTPIIKVNLEDKTVSPMEELTDRINCSCTKRMGLRGHTVSSCKDNIFISPYEDNKIFVVDYRSTEIIKKYDMGNVSIAGINIIDDESCVIWFADLLEIWKFYYRENRIIKMPINIDFFLGKNSFFNIIGVEKDRYLILPWKIHQLIFIDFSKRIVKEIEFPSEFERCNSFALLAFSKYIDDTIYLFPRGGNKLLTVNIKSLLVTAIDYIMTDELKDYANDILNQQFMNKFHSNTLNESIGWGTAISDFLNLVCTNKKKDLNNNDMNYGSYIHNTIKSLIV